MKRALLLWWAAAASVMSPAQAASTDPAALVRLAGSVLRVEAPTVDGPLAVGSAVTVAPERVVTNCHVTRQARTVYVIRGGVRWQAELQIIVCVGSGGKHRPTRLGSRGGDGELARRRRAD